MHRTAADTHETSWQQNCCLGVICGTHSVQDTVLLLRAPRAGVEPGSMRNTDGARLLPP
jgi:hypothetical protein